MTARTTAASETTYRTRDVLDALEAAGLTRKPGGLGERLSAVAAAEVALELSRPARFGLERLAVFLSPAAAGLIEDMAQAAYRLTRRRFGNAVSLFAPLYLSNHCVNQCRYCGFNSRRPHNRRRLSLDESMAEAEAIAEAGFRDLLLVSGEDRGHITVEYLCALAERLRRNNLFSAVSLEIYIQSEENYRRLFEAGIDGVTIFQETYDRDSYAFWHPGGPKASYEDRICASEAAARAGMRRIGLGVLLGLEDWRYDVLAMAVHADAIARNHWRARTSFSFPRIRPAESGMNEFPHIVGDADLTQMILALRLCFPDSGMTLSTRESPDLRDHLIPLGVTQISAGSKTAPGGYSEATAGDGSTAQFAVSDERGAGEMAEVLRRLGLDPVWKDWDRSFL